MLSSIAPAIISPAKQSIIGAIYSFSSLHRNECYVGQPVLVKNIALITVERETYMPRCSSVILFSVSIVILFRTLWKNLMYFDQKKLPAFLFVTVPLPLVKNRFSSPLRFCTYLQLTARSPLRFPKCSWITFAYLLLLIYDKKNGSILEYFVP